MITECVGPLLPPRSGSPVERASAAGKRPTFDPHRQVGGELELFVVERCGGRYRPALVSDRVFKAGPRLEVETAGFISREFHRDMIELNPDPCLAENLALQAAQIGITEGGGGSVIDDVLSAGPEMLEASLSSAASFGLGGVFNLPRGQRPMVEMWGELLDLARANLEARGLGEAGLLQPLERRVEARITPAEVLCEITRRDGLDRSFDILAECLADDAPLI